MNNNNNNNNNDMVKPAPRRKMTKKQYAETLLNKIKEYRASGLSPSDAIGRLSEKQYDTLIDYYGDTIDHLILSKEHKAILNEIKKTPRKRGMTYKKQYPEHKQRVFKDIVELLRGQGATIHTPDKKNYRDLSFNLGEIEYKIVLSNPRNKK